MIKSFVHKGLRRFFETGSVAGIQPKHAGKLQMILGILDQAQRIEEIGAPGYRLHPLKGGRAGTWSITVQANWRVTFRFVASDVEDVDYEDYH